MSRWLSIGCLECREQVAVGKDHWDSIDDNHSSDVMRFLLRHLGHYLMTANDGSDLLLNFKLDDPRCTRIFSWDEPPPIAPRSRPEGLPELRWTWDESAEVPKIFSNQL